MERPRLCVSLGRIDFRRLLVRWQGPEIPFIPGERCRLYNDLEWVWHVFRNKSSSEGRMALMYFLPRASKSDEVDRTGKLEMPDLMTGQSTKRAKQPLHRCELIDIVEATVTGA